MDDLLDLDWTASPALAPTTVQNATGHANHKVPTMIAPTIVEPWKRDNLSQAKSAGLSTSTARSLYSSERDHDFSRPSSGQSSSSGSIAIAPSRLGSSLAMPLAPTPKDGNRQSSRTPSPSSVNAFADLTGFKSPANELSLAQQQAARSAQGTTPISINAPVPFTPFSNQDLNFLEISSPRQESTSVYPEDDPFELSLLADRLPVAPPPNVNRPVENAKLGSGSVPTTINGARREKNIRRNGSPPPHVLGTLVEMGFNPQESLQALYDAGQDQNGQWEITRAAESLIKTGDQSSHQGQSSSGMAPRREYKSKPSERQVAEHNEESGQGPFKHETADEMIREARKFGASVLSQANSYWKVGKAAAQKAWEEQSRAMKEEKEGRQSPVKGNGRPRWMTNDYLEEEDKESIKAKTNHAHSNSVPAFIDLQRPHLNGIDQQTSRVGGSRQRLGSSPGEIRSKATQPAGTNRSGPLRANSRASGNSTINHPAVRPMQKNAAVELPPRQLVEASPETLTRMELLRTKGNSSWKAGQYGEAASFYTQAMATLPKGHIQCITLLNNRAAAYIKIGDARSALQDCDAVLTTIGDDLRPLAGSDLSLQDQKVKVLIRQAQAYELLEDWRNGEISWSRSLSIATGSTASQCNSGISRCRQMLRPSTPHTNDQPRSTPAPASTRRPVTSQPTSGMTKPGVALERVRRERNLAESEDLQRIALKDMVDSKIFTWKQGKESNLRALLSSMDLVLWPALDWKPVGLGELITSSKVKIHYMKAISKVHPDKIQQSATLDQKMISAAVFSTLNEAWDAFKTQNAV